jgi:hypothetical protein
MKNCKKSYSLLDIFLFSLSITIILLLPLDSIQAPGNQLIAWLPVLKIAAAS